MCGIVGIVGTSPVNQRIYDALTVLQHRGQDAAGIMTAHEGRLCSRKGAGLVRDVFEQHHMLELQGHVGIGHVRYPTAGCDSASEAQPFYVNAPYGICLAHNGNLTNAAELGDVVIREDRRHLNTESDSEVLLNIFASELQRVGTPRVTPADVFAAASAVYRRCRGGYAVVAMVIGHGILGFRDPNGIRPLVLGLRRTARGTEYMLASESVALSMLSFELVRDVAPGEAVFIDEQGRMHSQQCVATLRHTPCIFEYVYFARPDSIIDNISVYRARMRMGEKLAAKILRERPNHDIDVVIPIPDTSRTSALQMAQLLGIKYREGFTKNRYIGRTFIMPGQEQRERQVRRKLNAVGLEFRGKNVLLVDDSIVRGTTSAQIIDQAREAGAKQVYFASAAPPVRYPNVYGIDMPATDELVAAGRSAEEVAQVIGAD
jgi:amidophosphoribosyltransferase